MTLVCEELLHNELADVLDAYRGWEIFEDDLARQSSYATAVIQCFCPTTTSVLGWRYVTKEDFEHVVPQWKTVLTKYYDDHAHPILVDILCADTDFPGTFMTTLWLFPFIATEVDQWGSVDIGCFTNAELFRGQPSDIE